MAIVEARGGFVVAVKRLSQQLQKTEKLSRSRVL